MMMDKIEENDECKKSKNKKCFIITPIGEDNSPIRRHIDGIIDACIEPVLIEKGYDMEVSHRISTPGSINNRILDSIYSYDLAIANLTALNPNVMYELAFRHAVNKPVIMIMEKGSQKLPFDISGERTIFYINDSQGTIKLKDELRKVISSIEFSDKCFIDNPIYNAIKEIKENNNVLESIEKNTDELDPKQADTLRFILNKITNIENKINSNLTGVSNSIINMEFKKDDLFIIGNIHDIPQKLIDIVVPNFVVKVNEYKYMYITKQPKLDETLECMEFQIMHGYDLDFINARLTEILNNISKSIGIAEKLEISVAPF